MQSYSTRRLESQPKPRHLEKPTDKDYSNMPRRNTSPPLAPKQPTKNEVKTLENVCRAFIKKKDVYCLKPTVKGKKVCAGHGGLSTGPRTQEGLNRIAASKLLHGRETRARRFLRSQICHQLRQKEEEMYSLGLIHGPRLRGRKPTLWAHKGPL